MPKKGKQFTPDQMEQLAGEYKQSDNRAPTKNKRSVTSDSEGDHMATKRPQ